MCRLFIGDRLVIQIMLFQIISILSTIEIFFFFHKILFYILYFHECISSKKFIVPITEFPWTFWKVLQFRFPSTYSHFQPNENKLLSRSDELINWLSILTGLPEASLYVSWTSFRVPAILWIIPRFMKVNIGFVLGKQASKLSW